MKTKNKKVDSFILELREKTGFILYVKCFVKSIFNPLPVGI